ncbi:MAG: amidohydrolase family protein [Acidimicrobiales bacterium]
MPSRQLDFPVFDADNHMYETRDALTKFLPPEYAGVIDFVEVRGRTKITVKGHISDYIPNPSFDRVAAPGAQEEYFKTGNPEGRSRREIMGKAIDAIPAFREPVPRLKLMDELGLDRALMWPTLASLVEERLRDDPDATHAVVHALNQWMHEHWTFNFENRIFPAPIITLPIVEEAIKELHWVLDRGAKIILVRPAPVPGFRGPRSFALPEFDPFWELVQEADVVVGMHASDSGYQRYINEWEGIRDDEFTPFKGFGLRAITGAQHRDHRHRCVRHRPRPAAASPPEDHPVENGSGWVRRSSVTWSGLRHQPAHVRGGSRRGLQAQHLRAPFHEDDPVGLVGLLGPDNVLFGSDYPTLRAWQTPQLRRRPAGPPRRPGRQDHGRQPLPADERRLMAWDMAPSSGPG